MFINPLFEGSVTLTNINTLMKSTLLGYWGGILYAKRVQGCKEYRILFDIQVLLRTLPSDEKSAQDMGSKSIVCVRWGGGIKLV